MDEIKIILKNGITEERVYFYEGADGAGNKAGESSAKSQKEIFLGGGGNMEESEDANTSVIVSLDKNHLGHEIKDQKGSFNLSNIFSQDAKNLGSDRFTKVYFRTDSGNIYMLDSQGRLLNGRESGKRGEQVGFQLDGQKIEKAKLVVGEPFRYGDGGSTARIVEIVPVTDRQYDTDYLKTLTKGRHNAIGDDLVEMISKQNDVRQDPETTDKTNSKKQEIKLSKINRPYTVDDVRFILENFKAFKKMRERRGNPKFVISSSNWYDLLSTGSFSSDAVAESMKQTQPETPVNPALYDALLLDTYKTWRENIIANKDILATTRPQVGKLLGESFTSLEDLPDPKTASELRDFYRKYPILNEISAAHYQDGLSFDGGRENSFLHFHGHRMNGYQYQRSRTEIRLYLNPPLEALPLLARQAIDIANQEQIPFYFKLIDFSLRQHSAGELHRRDRMVFYTNQEHAGRIVDILSKIEKDHPEWFADRPLPPLTAAVFDGVGIAENPSDYQNEHFSQFGDTKTSFNLVRAEFLDEVWRDTAKEVIMRNPDLRPRGGRTFREIFRDQVPSADRPYVDHIWASGFNPDALNAKARRVMNDALKQTMLDVLSDITPDTLLPYVKYAISQKAKKYDINPNNIALNGHYYDK